MSASTAPNGFHAHQATGIEGEVRVDTPTMERLRRSKRERPARFVLEGPSSARTHRPCGRNIWPRTRFASCYSLSG